VGVGANVAMHAMGAARRSLRSMLTLAGLTLVTSLTGTAIAGTLGATWGLALGLWISTFIFWANLRRALEEYDANANAPAVHTVSLPADVAASATPALSQ
jgi:hypothetical protein